MHLRNDFPSNGISICTARGNSPLVNKPNRVNLETFTCQLSLHTLHVNPECMALTVYILTHWH